MFLDSLGKALKTNHTAAHGAVFVKRFHPFSPTMLWGALERKPYQGRYERYLRERDALRNLDYLAPMVPKLLDAEDHTSTLHLRTVQVTELSDALRSSTDNRARMVLIRNTFALLKDIHAAGVVHGDTYLKNWGVLPGGGPFVCDFEYRRDVGGRESSYDIALFAADVAAAMPADERAICQVVNDLYGPVTFDIDARDRFFFRARFGRDATFFERLSGKA